MRNLLLCFFVTFAFVTNAATIYVVPNGIANWTTPGSGSMALPYNLQYGFWAAAPGDTLLLKGTFARTEQIYIEKTDLTIGSWGTGAIIQGSNDPATAGFNLMVLKSCTNLTVENITFTQNYGNGSRGIYAWGKGDNITIKNCTFTNIGWSTNPLAIAPAGQGAHGILILGNKNSGSYTNINISGNTLNNMVTGWSESVTIIGNVDGFLIENNSITDVSNIGIDVAGHFSWVLDWDTNVPLNAALNQARNGRIKNNTVTNAISPIATSAGIYCDGCKDVIIERNIVTACGAGISIGCEVGGGKTASGVTVMNNIFQENIQSGMFLGSSLSEGAAQGPSSVDNCIIKNNTFYKNGDGNPINNYEVFLQNSKNNQFFNNILYIGNNARGIVSAVGPVVENFTMDYNLFYRANGSTADFVISAGSVLTGNTHSQVGDPEFTGEKNIDVSSRAANTGDPTTSLLAGELDRDGGVRKISTRVDIGAQESSSTATPASPNFFPIGEVGKITSSQSSSSQWQTITLNNSYASPVVVISPLSYNSSAPATVRVKNVTANSFQYQIDEWDYLDGVHSSETFFYMVIEEGHYELDNGVELQASTAQIGTSWSTISYPSDFDDDPLVFSQTVSYNDNSAVTTRMKCIDEEQFKLKIQEEEDNNNVHSTETVAWIAITEGSGESGLVFEADGTDEDYDHIFYEMYFNDSYTDPILFANMQTTEGNDPAALRYRFLEDDVVEIKVQEERSADNETGHTNEIIGFMVFEGSGNIFGEAVTSSRVIADDLEVNANIQITKDDLSVNVYPNPFVKELNINYDLKTDGDVELRVYGIDGKTYFQIKEFQTSGFQKITIPATELPKQMLLVELISNGQKQTQKVIAK